MKKIFVALSMVAFLVACDDSSSASAVQNDEPGMETSSSAELGSSSSEKAKSSSSVTQSDVKQSSSSEKTGKSSSSSAKSSSLSTGEDKGVYDAVKNTLTDLRDGQTYRTTTIKIFDAERGIDYSEVWMAENLNYETDNSFCSIINDSFCDTYGRMYTWAAAVDKPEDECGYEKVCNLPSGNIRGVCPQGWHLPSEAEWESLIVAVGGYNSAGRALKSKTGWDTRDGVVNDDTYMFSALPAGDRVEDGRFYNQGWYAYFWSSTENGDYAACRMYLNFGNDLANLSNLIKSSGFSVRCLKD